MTQSSIPEAEVADAIGDELPPGTQLCGGQYTIETYLNAGGFGVTYLARDSLDRKVVIKECFPNAMCCRDGTGVRLRASAFEEEFNRAVELFQKEARALARLQHPSIVGVHQIFEANDTAYMALDFINGMDLFDLMVRYPGHLTPDAIEAMVATLLNALSYMHERGILHRDISPDNILLDANGSPVLIDFGAARQGSRQQSKILSRVYTVKDGYSPHEFYFEGKEQSQASDLYALAATVVHLVTGRAPPNSSTRLARISEDKPDPFEPLTGRVEGHRPEFLQAVDQCMNLFAKDRLQTAAAWREIITGSAKVSPVGKPRLMSNADLMQRISEIVAVNQEALAREAQKRATAPVEEAKTPDPDEERRAAQRAYWAILNEDPEEIAAEIRREQEALERAEEEARRAEARVRQEEEARKAAEAAASEPRDLERRRAFQTASIS
ncbi:MAG: serine/threonine-protein kinase [Pseudomonadota bacterium]